MIRPGSWSNELRSHEHCEGNYLGRLEIIHFENIVGTRSSRRRISGVDSRGSTTGGGFGDTPYLNSLRMHGIGDRGSVAFSFLNLPLTHQTDHPEFWPVFSAIVLTHNYVSTAVLPSPICAPFAFSAGP